MKYILRSFIFVALALTLIAPAFATTKKTNGTGGGAASPGYDTATWNANGFDSGVYFYKQQVGSYMETKKMLLMK